MRKNKVETVEKEYLRFSFPGFGSEGKCYLKARISSEGIVIICSQLLNYNGTSVTNAVDQILLIAINRLQQEVGLNHLVDAKPWWRLFSDRGKFIEQVVKRTAWVEYYPPGTGLADNGSFALVAFDNNLNPIWNYVSEDVAAAQCGVPIEFLKIDPERLDNAA